MFLERLASRYLPVERQLPIIHKEYKGSVEISEIDPSNDHSKLVDLHKRMLPPHLQQPDIAENLDFFLSQKKGVNLKATGENGNIIGYILSLPLAEVLNNTPSTAYVPHSSIAEPGSILYVAALGADPGCTSLRSVQQLLYRFRDEAKTKGYKKIDMHARKNTGLSNVLQKRYGGKVLQSFQTLSRFQEPFDYIQFDLTSSD